MSKSKGYISAYPDPRESGRISLQSLQANGLGPANALPIDLFITLILSKSLVSLSYFISKEWFFKAGLSVPNLTFFSLLTGTVLAYGLARLSSDTPPPVRYKAPHYVYSISMFAEVFLGYLSLSQLSVLRFVILTTLSAVWARGIPLPCHNITAWKSSTIAVSVLLLLAFLLDTVVSGQRLVAPYLFTALHILASGQRVEMFNTIVGGSSSKRIALFRGLALATAASFVVFVLGYVFSSGATVEAVVRDAPSLSLSVIVPCLVLIAFSVHILDPFILQNLLSPYPAAAHIFGGWILSVLSAAFVGSVGLKMRPEWAEVVLVPLMWFGVGQIALLDTRSSVALSVALSTDTSASYTANKSVFASLSQFYHTFKNTIKAILDNAESRRIYYFLCLNLAFMFVQMAYGIWTNSLGLISDSIHMFFDCLALAMGLFASIMATWTPNEKFTYGYTRVETLSGFANGLFLCLISVFIVFEAIGRLVNPPEMNTNQLLAVSTLGLLVNLVGMFATGHHHHGHSHAGHDHDHHSHNMKGVFLHVLADTLGSVGVIISTLLINRYGWTGFDPIASIFIAVLIFASVVPLVSDAGQLLILDIGPDLEHTVTEALSSLSSVPGLASYASPKFWSLDSETTVGSITLYISPAASSFTDPSTQMAAVTYNNVDKVRDSVEALLKSKIHGLSELTIQVEGSTIR